MPFTYCLRKLWPLHRGWKCMAALLACLCLLPDMAAHAQSPPRKVVVNGRVADESGDPVAGATIVERGTSNGVATLSEGEFSIAVLPGAVLDVSCLGYIDQSIGTGTRTEFEIVLQEDVKAIAEVVVTAGEGSGARTWTVEVVQNAAGTPEIVATPNRVLIPACGSLLSASTEIACNYEDWEFTQSCDWMLVERRQDKLVFTADENTSSESRQVEVKLTAGYGDRSISETVVVSPSGTGIFAAIACAGVSCASPPNGINTVPAPIVESNRSTRPFWEQTLRSPIMESHFSRSGASDRGRA